MASIQNYVYPLVYIAIQKSLIALLLAFSSPTSSLRFLLFPIVVICNIHLLPKYKSYIPRSPWVAFVSGDALSGILDYIEKLLLSRWSFGHYGPSAHARSKKTIDTDKGKAVLFGRQPNSEGSIWERVKFGVWVATSSRYIASPYQARHVPPYSTTNPSYVPTRTAFLLRKALIFIICYLLLDVLTQGNQPDQNVMNYAVNRVPFFSRLGEVTTEEAITRIITTVAYWVGSYVVVQGYYTGLAFISVLSGLDCPELWRPNFGSLREIYTIRGFWGLFWHQFMRKKLSKPARYITFNIFNFPRPTAANSYISKIFTRYTELFFVFLISGVVHHAIEVAQGMTWTESGATQFFVMMAVAIVLEDGVQWVYYDHLMGGPARGKWWAKAVGYVWVVMVLAYATPFWAYPSLRKNTGGKATEVLPFSIIKLIK